MTFTLTAYVVDVYRAQFPRRTAIELHSGLCAVLSPSDRRPDPSTAELVPQLVKVTRALDARFTLGASLVRSRSLQKADLRRCYLHLMWINRHTRPATHSAYAYLLAIYGFSMQIYCDFSGYTDMAVGLAYILRIRLPQNFRSPYNSKSIVEFWRRWHITLSLWLRDYLYIAMGGNRRGFARQLANLMITMLIGGLWHGANWTFVIWGGLHGIAIGSQSCIQSLLAERQDCRAGSDIFITFHFVTIAWIYFRAPDVASAIKVLAGPFTGKRQSVWAPSLRSTLTLSLSCSYSLPRTDSTIMPEFGLF